VPGLYGIERRQDDMNFEKDLENIKIDELLNKINKEENK
jgi:hypothetical protein